ncbi:MAG TPA: hypothetical protein VJ385_19960, partial [Fibrobacteria bacterium]|nr:hypothetical protein [Fibrobacteria bacterium]
GGARRENAGRGEVRPERPGAAFGTRVQDPETGAARKALSAQERAEHRAQEARDRAMSRIRDQVYSRGWPGSDSRAGTERLRHAEATAAAARWLLAIACVSGVAAILGALMAVLTT